MNPAFSVIFFTTASGAGYALLALMCVMAAFGWVPADKTLGSVGLGLSFVLVSGGLLSSTFHLGHPERAWRAFTQWKTSWLSREGVLSILTYIPWVLVAYAWIIQGDLSGIWAGIALLTAVLAALTVYATAMIYRSLATVHQWHNGWTVLGYFVVGLGSGAVWMALVLAATVGVSLGFLVFAILAVATAFLTKRVYWSFIDTTQHPSNVKTATGLDGAEVRLFESPHTEENYLMQEMGFKVGRKHAEKLRAIASLFGFLGAAVFLVLAVLAGGSVLTLAAVALAAVCVSIGAVVERWLFFAEARHVVTLYYGAEAA